MSGYPIRPDRDAFGPRPENRHPVRDPKRELDGPTIGDLMMWTIAGSGVCVARARAHCSIIAGPDIQLDASAEAWDPNGTVLPTVGRVGAGHYTVTYAATAPDKDGVAKSIVLDGCSVAIGPNAATRFSAWAFLNADKRSITVRTFNNADANTDMPAGSQINVFAW